MADRHLIDVHVPVIGGDDVLLTERRDINPSTGIRVYRDRVSVSVRGFSMQAIPEGAPA